ncbi:MAG TPA: DUF4919 domain-containing protein [Thermoanaerobaculia bacterium]|jgi:hypothetical protein
MIAKTACRIGAGLLLLCAGVPVALAAPQTKPTYESLLERAKRQDPGVDFTALRMAYFEAPKHGTTDSDLRKAMFSALGEKNYDQALAIAGQILNVNYLDIDAHLISALVSKKKNDLERQKLHDFVGKGLTQSILRSGDGKTLDTAYVVISVDEEYSLLRVLGLRMGGQTLLNAGAHHYDQMDVSDPKTGQKLTVYFNIDKPYAEELKMFQ